MREQISLTSNSIDLEEWEKVDDFLGNSTSTVTSHEGMSSSTARQGQSRGQSTLRRASVHKGTVSHSTAAAPAAMARSPKIWIAGILALSVFWCMVSLIAISRLETRLPSEMQEQLEFHASFSGLWPRSQAGSNASSTGMHLPFAEASMSHKHRKRRPRITGEQEEGQGEQDLTEEADSDDALFSPADASTDFRQQPPSLATEVYDEVGEDWSIWQPAVAALKAVFSAEQSDRQMLRGLRSVQS